VPPRSALLAAALFVPAAFAQPPLIRVDVREVWVPVYVTDARGHTAGGLKASDFALTEDGIPQTISAFASSTAPGAEAVLQPAGASAPESKGAAASPPHTYVICLDTLHLDPGGAASLHSALRRLFEKEKPANARFSVVALGRQLQVLATATTDPAAVAARIAKAPLQPAGEGAAALESELRNLKSSMYDFCRRCPACGSHASGRSCDSDVQSLAERLDAQAAPWGMRTAAMLDQLRLVVEELAKLPGGRTLLFVSGGFSLRPARDFYAVAAAFLPGDPRFQAQGSTDLDPRLQAVIRAAVDGNVRIQSIDARGVVASAGGAGSLDAANPEDWSPPSVIRKTPPSSRGGTLLSDMDHEAASLATQNGAGMSQLAESTGGVWYHGSNDALPQLRAALADGREYYLLGYVPTKSAPDGQFHAIAVTVRGAKLHVRAKSGYWAAN
jgi:VWFA-related protein